MQRLGGKQFRLRPFAAPLRFPRSREEERRTARVLSVARVFLAVFSLIAIYLVLMGILLAYLADAEKQLRAESELTRRLLQKIQSQRGLRAAAPIVRLPDFPAFPARAPAGR